MENDTAQRGKEAGAHTYTLYYRASIEHPISLAQMRRNGQMSDLLRDYGLRGCSLNVGHDAQLAARVMQETGVEDEFPVAYIDGEPIGTLEALRQWLEQHAEERGLTLSGTRSRSSSISSYCTSEVSGDEREGGSPLLAASPTLQEGAWPNAPFDDSHLSLSGDTEREQEEQRFGDALVVENLLDSMELKAREAPGGTSPLSEEEKEEAALGAVDESDLLDMRLSVLGRQVRRDSGREFTTRYPNLASMRQSPSKRAASQEQGANSNSNDGASNATKSLSPHDMGSEDSLNTVNWALEGFEWALREGLGYIMKSVTPEQKANSERARRQQQQQQQMQAEAAAAAAEREQEAAVSASPRATDDSIDFDVVRTNWYWRQQKRILRICPTELQRVHPMTGEVRSRIAYKDIDKVVVTDDNLMYVVRKNADEQKERQDYYQSRYVTNIVECIVKRQPDVHIERRESEGKAAPAKSSSFFGL